MKLITLGCSYTRDNYQDTWADLLAKDHGFELHNLAERGAGADYVTKRLLTANITKDDIVVIMWPSADRFDLWADKTTPHLLQDYVYASWPDGVQPRLIDLHGQRRLDHGYILNGSVPRGYKHNYFKYFYSPFQVVHDWYVSIITAQLYLKSVGANFYMTSAFPIQCPISYHHGLFEIEPDIFEKIDQACFVDTQGFYVWARNKNKPFLNSHYPATASHREYVDVYLAPAVKKALDQRKQTKYNTESLT